MYAGTFQQGPLKNTYSIFQRRRVATYMWVLPCVQCACVLYFRLAICGRTLWHSVLGDVYINVGLLQTNSCS